MSQTPEDSSLAAPPEAHSPLRRADRITALHPLKQDPPSILGGDHAGFDDVDIGSSPLPVRPLPSALALSGLSSTPTHYDPHGVQPLEPLSLATESLGSGRPARGHTRSLTGTFLENCQPFLSRATSTFTQHTAGSGGSLHSPSKSLASFIPARSSGLASTSSTASPGIAAEPKLRAGAKALSSWFNGTSAPVRLGIANSNTRDDQSESGEDYASSDSDSDDDGEPNMMSSLFNRSAVFTGTAKPPPSPAPGPHDAHAKPTDPNTTPKPKRPQRQTQSCSTSTSTARTPFSWLLSTPTKRPHPPKKQNYHNPSDELLDLNINTALFPHGPADPLDPNSFHDLLSAAEALLTRYQDSYRQLSTALRDARAEQDAQHEELDESETRARHLKMQLDTLGARSSARDGELERLQEELDLERRARKELETELEQERGRRRREAASASSSEQHRPGLRKNRVSGSEISVDSGYSGFESEPEVDMSDRVYAGTPAESDVTLVSQSHHQARLSPSPQMGQGRPRLPRQKSLYEQLCERERSLSPAPGSHGSGGGQQVPARCDSCVNGAAKGDVWARLAREREESQVLRRRVEELESAVDGVLGVVRGHGV